ncbi:uncharacterized protein LOC125373214 [Haliotis rufescens]|uniref:uncharacterized protein LOC125373214 n=1 Tax=Haliotis rufescens TaxID=6454 RepID=UPI00201F7B59|nr:uncharacterized protein LOC125373214 [Haliotis rufescens]
MQIYLFIRFYKMRLALLFLVAVLVLQDVDARRRWLRIRIRVPRVIRVVRTVLPIAEAIIKGKRDTESYDLNGDGQIDQSEAEKIFEARDAEEFLSLADTDGDATVSLGEFEESLNNILKLTDRDADFARSLEESMMRE